MSRLSNRGLYAQMLTRTPVHEAIEYEPDYPLWSDGAAKRRWLILPPGETIDTSDMAHWNFPVGTKVFKEFSLRGKLLETRLVERIRDDTRSVKGDFFMGTFVWNSDQSDAFLFDDGVQNVLGTEHDVPEKTACPQCHKGEPSAVLGISAVQGSRSGMLDTLAKRNLLSDDPGRNFPIPGDEIQIAAVGYLNANCGHCHSAEGIANQMRLRFLPTDADQPIEQSDFYTTTIHHKITDWKVPPDDVDERIVPGDTDHSAITYRMKQRGTEKPASDDAMPPLATEQVHLEGVAAVEAWIRTMPHDLVVPEDSETGGGAGAGDAAAGGGGAGGRDEHAAAAGSAGSRAAQADHPNAGTGESHNAHAIAGSDAKASTGNTGSSGHAAAGVGGSAGAENAGGAGAGGMAGASSAGAPSSEAGAGAGGAPATPVDGGSSDGSSGVGGDTNGQAGQSGDAGGGGAAGSVEAPSMPAAGSGGGAAHDDHDHDHQTDEQPPP